MAWKRLIGVYEVSDDGQIRNRQTGHVRKPKVLPPYGYLNVTLSVDGRLVYYYVHRAVLEAFVGPCPEGMQTRHLNDIKSDNRLENLAWGTPKENAQDAIVNERVAHGERLSALLTEDQVREILVSLGSQKLLADRYGVSSATIGAIQRGRNWTRVFEEMGMKPRPRVKTHCKHGHPFSGENLSHSGRRRVCLACQRDRTNRYLERKKSGVIARA